MFHNGKAIKDILLLNRKQLKNLSNETFSAYVRLCYVTTTGYNLKALLKNKNVVLEHFYKTESIF